jgi:folylpolyglutamate synthase/dihydropteroate synthase
VIAERLGAEGRPVELFDGVTEAIGAAIAVAEPGDCVLITGSLYTVADARRAFA